MNGNSRETLLNSNLSQATGSTPGLGQPAIFVSLAALISGLINPIYVDYAPQLLPTLLINVFAIALVWLGALRGWRWLFSGASAVLFALVAAQVTTQPASLAVPVILTWPFRILSFVVIVACWSLFMRPPSWLRRAVLAIVIPTVLVLGGVLAPSAGALLFGWQTATRNSSFPPYWLALDSSGTLYATGLHGGVIQVFAAGGNPKGTLRPAAAPDPPTPGPGILPNGMEEELARLGFAALPTAVVVRGKPVEPPLDFCGIAVDEQDNLYTISMQNPLPYQILKFDRNGALLARIPLPADVIPGEGCLAVGAGHIYVHSVTGQIFIMDRQGAVQLVVQGPYQLSYLAPTPDGRLIALSPRSLAFVDVRTGQVTLKSIAITTPPQFSAVAVAQNGDLLIAESVGRRILRFDRNAERQIGTIGGPGTAPGQFGAINGLAIDAAGRIYVADWRYRVIQRFSPDGQIDALWWAASVEQENGGE